MHLDSAFSLVMPNNYIIMGDVDSKEVVSEKPEWGKKCTQCLACIHYCPTKAIQYGKGTQGKGRYRNPNVKVEEMMEV